MTTTMMMMVMRMRLNDETNNGNMKRKTNTKFFNIGAHAFRHENTVLVVHTRLKLHTSLLGDTCLVQTMKERSQLGQNFSQVHGPRVELVNAVILHQGLGFWVYGRAQTFRRLHKP